MTCPQRLWISGGVNVVRANLEGVFPTYKTLKDGTRRILVSPRDRQAAHGKPGSPEFITDYATAEKLIRDRLAGTFNGLVRCYTLSVEFSGSSRPARRPNTSGC